MSKFKSITHPLRWFMALAVTVLAVGCGNGDPILGGGGAGAPGTLTDVIKPRVTVTLPATTTSGPTAGPAANAAITVTFTEAMLSSTIDSTSFSLVNTTTTLAVAGTVTYISASKTARFKPDANMTAGQIYTATVTGIGANPVTDLAGNALAGNTAALPAASDYVWTFIPTTDDSTAPTITSTFPADSATNVSLNASVNATFNEAMDPATICGAANLTTECPVASFTLVPTNPAGSPVSAVVTLDQVNNIATFNPASNLAALTEYTATITNTVTDLAGNALAVGATNPWIFTTGTANAPGAIALGSASTFGIMATSAITSTGNSIINGDVSLDPGTSMTGFPPAIVNGSIHINDTVSAQARTDLLKAYNDAKALPPGTTISGGADLGALYPSGIPPGTYTSNSTMSVESPLVLDAGGNANAVWVFQIGSSLTTTTPSGNVTLLNGAQAKNVFWVPTSDATIGVGTTFSGTIVSGRDVTAETGATINGRILAGAITAGTIALQGTTVNVPLP